MSISSGDRCRKYKYGITVEQFEALMLVQGGRCAICREVPAGIRPLCIDHDHSCCPGVRSCGRCVRGLVCKGCNIKLGAIESALYPNLLEYLETHRGIQSPVV